VTADFDFDTTYNEEAEEEEVDLDEGVELDDDLDEEAPRRSSPFRIILLVLILIVLACVVCFLASRYFGDRLPLPPIPGLPIGGETSVPPVDTPTVPATTGVTEVPPEETSQLPPTTEEAATEVPTSVITNPEEETPLPGTEEPTSEPTVIVTTEPIVEPTGGLVDEHGADMVTEQPTTEPGPGTPGATVIVTVDTCDNNTPPTANADGPYTAMMGKGQAFVTFDGSGSSDPDGTIARYEWDFGDGSTPETGSSVNHGYGSTGSFVVTLTVTDNCGDSSQATADVTIVGPTPPANGNGSGDGDSNATPAAMPQSPSAPETVGFCHRVQAGETLYGLAWNYDLTVRDLADVNGVDTEYLVVAGQGLFIPIGEINGGLNIYEVQYGETLYDVAYQCGLTVSTLATTNGLEANADLFPGQNLIIPPWSQVNP
jgi:LysM repeat protein